jgi:hypothetical protein
MTRAHRLRVAGNLLYRRAAFDHALTRELTCPKEARSDESVLPSIHVDAALILMAVAFALFVRQDGFAWSWCACS